MLVMEEPEFNTEGSKKSFMEGTARPGGRIQNSRFKIPEKIFAGCEEFRK